ncbi:MAG: acetyltransferase [Bifidobacteriaceae bacterium]|nr:acetyltransferase [Bifidobacteriaceae bacterium]
MGFFAAPSADVDQRATIGDGSKIWHLAQLREGAELGQDCVIGRGAYIGAGVHLGAGCKVQNYALVYEPADLADGVFIGPAAVLTNDTYPRAVNPDGSPKSGDDWEHVGVTIKRGASIGARAVCVAPVVIGQWAMVAAGAVVVKDVPDHALVVGAPARQIGWVGKSGRRLQPDGDQWVCPASGARYQTAGHNLEEVQPR